MRTLLLAFILASLPASAHAAESWLSEPQSVNYVDVHDVFSVVTFDTGTWPSSGPLGVRFHVTPTGGVMSDIRGISHLEWQATHDATRMEHTVVGEAGGWFGVDSSVEVAAEVHIDIGGVYTGTVNLWGQNIDLYKGVELDSLVLANGHESASVVLEDRSLINPFAYNFQVIPGVDLVLAVEMFPTLRAGLAGLSLDTEFMTGTSSFQFEGEWSELPVPVDAAPGLMGLSEYTGDIEALLSFVIEPTLRVDTPIGAFDLARFPIPVDLLDESEIRTFEPALVDHPLPVLDTLPAAYDFGPIRVGDRANWELKLDNLGHLELLGEAQIQGSSQYTVWPDFLYATPALGDGLVVSWSPSSAGKEEAWLVLTTSDPAQPEVRILLSGHGVSDDGGPRDGQRSSTHFTTSGCGCATPGSTPGILAWLLLPMLYLRRRSTNFTRR